MSLAFRRGGRLAMGLVAVLSFAAASAQPATATTPPRVWAKTYDGPASQDDFGQAVAVSPNGTRVFTTGRSVSNSTSEDYATVAYDSSGTQLWAKRYDGPGHLIDEANAIAVSPDGARVFIAGASFGAGTGEDYATIAYDAATGARLWVRRFDDTAHGFDVAHDVAVSPGGKLVYVTGGSQGHLFDYFTIAYDAATGAKRWAKRFNGPANEEDTAYALGVAGGRVYVTGDSEDSNSQPHVTTVAYGATTGSILWTKTYITGTGFDLVVSADGTRIYVTGARPSATVEDYVTIAYRSDGSKAWIKAYAGPGKGQDQANAVAVSADGSRVYVTGQSPGTGSGDDYATIAYRASDGFQQWVRRFNGGGSCADEGEGVGVKPDGSQVYVTGAVCSGAHAGQDPDVGTIAYDPSGSPLWTDRFRPDGIDRGDALVVSTDGTRLYVAGEAQAQTGSKSADYVTIAYDV